MPADEPGVRLLYAVVRGTLETAGMGRNGKESLVVAPLAQQTLLRLPPESSSAKRRLR